MTGPGWVDPLPQPPHPKSALVVFIPRVISVFTPCHGVSHFFDPGEAVAGAWLKAVCADCGARRTVELQADSTEESGLRALWANDDLPCG